MRILLTHHHRCQSWISVLLAAVWLAGLSQLGLQPSFGQEPLPVEQLPLAVEPTLAPLTSPSDLASEEVLPGQALTEDQLLDDKFDGQLLELEPESTYSLVDFPFGYNTRQSKTDWLVGGGNKFGFFSLENLPTLPQDRTSGVVTGLGFHFLSGPVITDMPPRLFDFQIGYQKRTWLSENFGYDVAARIGAFSDFEGSAREGVRFPGHAVGYYRWSPLVDVVLGIDYLGRDDVKLLPVAGLIITPREDLRLELVFPRPRVEVQVSPTNSVYIAGELGGGTWAIERVTDLDDVVTYRDLNLLFGWSTRDAEGDDSTLEIGYVFDRRLSYRSGVGDYSPGDAILIRLTTRY
ncbi:hypothetical protein NA78x_003107 [Anatilimnocola sp. NA78]|uniref:hypothetical protein n=1 Tax=Anatilimnocola sp. NA78 TaxID=3415683 RepID=UPI003CE48D31